MANRTFEQPIARGSDARWWLDAYKDNRAEKVIAVASQLWVEAESFRTGCDRWGSFYENDPFKGSGYFTRWRRRDLSVTTRHVPLSYNVIKAVADTFVSLITRDQPKVSCVTSGATWSVQQQARQVESFISGVLYENDAYNLATEVAFDVAKFGTGVFHVFADKEEEQARIEIERVWPFEMLVGRDGHKRKPQSLYRVMPVDRLALMERFPDSADEISIAGSQGFEGCGDDTSDPDGSDMLAVVEAWHLPTGKAKGRHCIVTGRATLLDEEWTRKDFPFVWLYRQVPTKGMFGQSFGQELSSIQLAIIKLLNAIANAQHLVVGHYMVEESSHVNTGTIGNLLTSIKYRGTPPQYQAPEPVAESTYSHLDRHWQRAFEVIGVSANAAQSTKPAGLNSGKALLVYADTQSQRFQNSYALFQGAFLELGRKILHTARELGDDGFYVKAAGRNVMRTVKWADAGGLAQDQFILRLYPTNNFADDPSARLQQVQEYMQGGLLTPRQGRRLLDMPDLDEEMSQEDASYQLVMSLVSKILDEGAYIGPEPFMDIKEAISIVQLEYLRAKRLEAPRDRLALLQRWIAAAKALLDAAQPPAAPAPGSPGAPLPPGGPLVGKAPPPAVATL